MTEKKIKQARVLLQYVDGSEQEVSINGHFHAETLQLVRDGGRELRYHLTGIAPSQATIRESATASTLAFDKLPPLPLADFMITNADGPVRIVSDRRIKPAPKYQVNDLIEIPPGYRPLITCPKSTPSRWRVTNVVWSENLPIGWVYTVTDRQDFKTVTLKSSQVRTSRKIDDWPYRGGDFVTHHGEILKLKRRITFGETLPNNTVVSKSWVNRSDGTTLWLTEREDGTLLGAWDRWFLRAEVKVDKTVKWTVES
jgi:hypothetical protein